MRTEVEIIFQTKKRNDTKMRNLEGETSNSHRCEYFSRTSQQSICIDEAPKNTLNQAVRSRQ